MKRFILILLCPWVLSAAPPDCNDLLNSYGYSSVILYGEGHSNPSHSANRRFLIKEAFEGRLLLALEGFTLEQTPKMMAPHAEELGIRYVKGRVFGLEAEMAHAFMGVAAGHNFVITNLSLKKTKELVFKRALTDYLLPVLLVHPVARKAWAAFRKASPLKGQIVDGIDQLVKDIDSGRDPKMLDIVSEANDEVRALLEPFMYSFSQFLLKPQYAGTAQFPENFRARIEEYFAAEDYVLQTEIMNSINLEWRDKFFAKAIQKLIAKSKRRKVPLVVVMGRDHLPGVERLLRDSGNESLAVAWPD